MAEEVEMGVIRWLMEELRAVLLAGLYFAAFFFVVLLLQALLLEEHGIALSSFSIVLVLALVTAKVVVLLDRAPLGHRIGLIEIALRTGLYTLAAFTLLLLEKAFSSREAAGGFAPALRTIFSHPEMPQIWATILCLAIAFAGYLTFAVARRKLGDRLLSNAFLGRELERDEATAAFSARHAGGSEDRRDSGA